MTHSTPLRASEKHAFGPVLAATRKEQGYATPFAFFRARGGRRGLGLTFANYLSLEKGENLPKGWRLKKLVDALGLQPDSPRANQLVRAYFTGVLGSTELLDVLLGAAGDPMPASAALAERAAKRAMSATKVQLDLSQYKTLAENPAAYACHVILCNTAGWTELATLAKVTGVAAPLLRKELAKLKAAKLVKLSGTQARSTLEEKFVEPPAPTVSLSAVYARLAEHRRRWEERSTPAHHSYLLVRARRPQMAQYLEHLGETVKMSSLYGDTEPAADSEMYLVEGKVTRLFTK